MNRRTLPWIIAGIVVVVVLVVLAPRSTAAYDLESTDGDGTDMLRRILVDEFDVEVVAATSLDDVRPDDVVGVFEDRLTAVDEQALATHVEAGGRAVVADPRLAIAGASDVQRGDPVGEPDCDLLPNETAVGFRPGPYDQAPVLTSFVPPADATATCWRRDGRAHVALRAPDGGGTVVVLGGPEMVTNQGLGNLTGTTQVVPLFLPDGDGRVVVVRGTAVPPPGTGAPGELPDNLRLSMVLLAVALVAFGLSRFRRLGPVLHEEPLVRVPASQLAVGIADLLQRHGHAARAGDHVRSGLRADLARSHGMVDDDPRALVATTVVATGLSEDVVTRAVAGPAVATEAELMAVVAATQQVRAHLRLAASSGGTGSGHVASTSTDPTSTHPTSTDPTSTDPNRGPTT